LELVRDKKAKRFKPYTTWKEPKAFPLIQVDVRRKIVTKKEPKSSASN